MSSQNESKLTKSGTKTQTKEELILAQTTTKKIVHEIFNSLRVGMDYAEAKQLAIEIFKKNGVFKWHDIVIHFGKNCNNGYYTKGKNDVSIKFDQNDVAFIDIGVVVHKRLEGDYGQTFYSGSNIRINNLINMSKYFWHFGKKIWLQQRGKITGVELYAILREEVEKSGFVFKPEIGATGHQVGIFLHDGPKLWTYPKAIEENIWILEIFIYDQELDRGAFYEDALVVKDGDYPTL